MTPNAPVRLPDLTGVFPVGDRGDQIPEAIGKVIALAGVNVFGVVAVALETGDGGPEGFYRWGGIQAGGGGVARRFHVLADHRSCQEPEGRGAGVPPEEQGSVLQHRVADNQAGDRKQQIHLVVQGRRSIALLRRFQRP